MKTTADRDAEWRANQPATIKPTVVTETGGIGERIRKTHPAFGMIRFSRISGGMPKMFGSELQALSCIRMTVERGTEEWSLSDKRYMTDHKPLIEVDLTAAQFAELLTSMNVGMGVPCTINRTETDWKIPHIADDGEDLHTLIKEDLKRDTAEISATLKALTDDLKATLAKSGLSKTKQGDLLAHVEKLDRDINANLPFVMDQYSEAMEKVKASAKAEVDAFATNAAMQLGVKRLQDLAALVEADVGAKKLTP